GVTNFQEIFAEYLKPTDVTGSHPTCNVELVDASVAVRDLSTAQQWQCKPVNLTVKVDEEALEIEHAELSWQPTNLWGIPIGPGQLKGAMKQGVATFEPVNTTIGTGRMHLLPKLHLEKETSVELGAGSMVDNVELNTQLCNRALAYIAPVLAGSVQVQGRFS